MHPNAQRVQNALRSHGVECEVVELPSTTRSAAEAAKAIGTSVAKIVKCLIFEADGQPILVLAAGTNRVSLAKLEVLIGHPPFRADADAVKRYTGFPIGGVAPVGLERKMPVFIDADLFGQTELWAAAGTPHAVFRCAAGELAQVSGGIFADVKE